MRSLLWRRRATKQKLVSADEDSSKVLSQVMDLVQDKGAGAEATAAGERIERD
jgi:hypothetical protein